MVNKSQNQLTLVFTLRTNDVIMRNYTLQDLV